jgi:hypothetical protein
MALGERLSSRLFFPEDTGTTDLMKGLRAGARDGAFLGETLVDA